MPLLKLASMDEVHIEPSFNKEDAGFNVAYSLIIPLADLCEQQQNDATYKMLVDEVYQGIKELIEESGVQTSVHQFDVQGSTGTSFESGYNMYRFEDAPTSPEDLSVRGYIFHKPASRFIDKDIHKSLHIKISHRFSQLERLELLNKFMMSEKRDWLITEEATEANETLLKKLGKV